MSQGRGLNYEPNCLGLLNFHGFRSSLVLLGNKMYSMFLHNGGLEGPL